MTDKKFIVVGAGKLGSYHLQGLAKISENALIDVYDISEKSLQMAHKMLSEVNSISRHQIRFISDLQNLRDDYVLGINATTSGFRLDSVMKTGHLAKNWILEKVLTQNISQIDAIEEYFTSDQNVWVNLTMRELPWLQEAQLQFKKTKLLNFDTSGVDWSLACNAIHHLDLIGWFADAELISLNCDQLDDSWFHSKRKGHFEIFGTIKAEYSNGTTASLTSSPLGINRISTLTTEKNIWLLDETAGEIKSSDGLLYKGVFERQSNLTTRLADMVINHRKLNIPKLDYAAKMHRIYIKAMLDHWNECQVTKSNFVPIT